MDVFRKGRNDDEPAFTLRPAIPGLKGIVIGIAVLIGAVILFSLLLRVTRIEAGHVGVEINLAGQQRGASEIPYSHRLGPLFAADHPDHRISHLRADGEMDERRE